MSESEDISKSLSDEIEAGAKRVIELLESKRDKLNTENMDAYMVSLEKACKILALIGKKPPAASKTKAEDGEAKVDGLKILGGHKLSTYQKRQFRENVQQ